MALGNTMKKVALRTAFDYIEKKTGRKHPQIDGLGGSLCGRWTGELSGSACSSPQGDRRSFL